MIIYYSSINKKLRIKYEQGITLPESAENIQIKSKWWIPRNINFGQSSSASFTIDTADFKHILSQYDVIHLEEDTLGFKRFSVPINASVGSVTNVRSYEIDNGLLKVEINTGYN